jgi:hypothetical protein
MSEAFEKDDKIQTVAEAYAQDAIDFVRAHYSKRLNWSDESIRDIEEVAAHLHDTLPDPRPAEEQIFGMAKMLGSYVGEVFRRNHGALWGRAKMGGESFPGLQGLHDGVTFWPWGRVQNRLINGPEDNIWHYYQILVADHAAPMALAQKPWWRKLFS